VYYKGTVKEQHKKPVESKFFIHPPQCSHYCCRSFVACVILALASNCVVVWIHIPPLLHVLVMSPLLRVLLYHRHPTSVVNSSRPAPRERVPPHHAKLCCTISHTLQPMRLRPTHFS